MERAECTIRTLTRLRTRSRELRNVLLERHPQEESA